MWCIPQSRWTRLLSLPAVILFTQKKQGAGAGRFFHLLWLKSWKSYDNRGEDGSCEALFFKQVNEKILREHENFIIVCHLWVLLQDFLFEEYQNSFRASNGPSGLDRLLVHDRDPQMVFWQRRFLKHLTESIYYYISAQIQDLQVCVIDWVEGSYQPKEVLC